MSIPFTDPPELRTPTRVAIALGLVALLSLILWSIRDLLTLANFSLLYLLLTLIIAIWLGIAPSLITAFVSFFCFNFFLIRPYYTLKVEDPRELLDLFIYLLVALITGQLASYARKQAQAARHRANEQNILYELSSAFNRLNNRENIYQTLRDAVHENLSITSYTVFDATNTTSLRDNQTTIYLLIGMNTKCMVSYESLF